MGNRSCKVYYEEIIMSDCHRFIDYTEFFGDAALAGIYSYESVGSAVTWVRRVNTNSFTVTEKAIKARNQLIADLLYSKDQIQMEAQSLSPMRNSFRGLSSFLQECSGQTVNEYLTFIGEQVNETYALITEDLIDRDNVES